MQDMQVVADPTGYRSYYTELEKVKSGELARRVVHDLNLAQKPNFLFQPVNFSLGHLMRRAMNGLGLKPEAPAKTLDSAEREALAISRVYGGLSASFIEDTNIITITFSDTSPKYASTIANQLAKSYIDQQFDRSAETSDIARQLISEQVGEVKNRLQISEQELVAYAKAQNITMTGDNDALVATNIKAINDALSAAIRERLLNERIVAQIEAGKSASLQQILDNETIQSMRGRLSELKGEYQHKLATFKPGFPEMRRLKAQMTELERQINNGIETVAGSIRLRHENSIEREHDLKKKLSEFESEYSAFQDKSVQYTILKREVDSNRKQYDSLIDKLNEVGVGSEFQTKRGSIIGFAVTPGAPYSPRLSRNLAMTLAVAMALIGAIIYLLEILNNTFRSPDQIESELKAPLLGIIPYATEKELTEQLGDPQSEISEAFRSLRTALQFTGTEGAPRVMAITSAVPSEGKSTVARKLAEEFGAVGKTVLIMDGDMRRPNLHRILDVSAGLGLSNLLTNMIFNDGADELRGIFKKSPWDNVSYITAGTLPPNPANLLSSEKMGRIIHGCSGKFDIILIDAPPIIGIADALLLSRLADATLFVVSADQVSRKAAKAASERLSTAGGNLIGAVFTKFDGSKAEYGSSYRYMTHNYYNYGDRVALNGREAPAHASDDVETTAPSHNLRARLLRYLTFDDERD
jgi:capsular exopolysaccharide synthesis family protein